TLWMTTWQLEWSGTDCVFRLNIITPCESTRYRISHPLRLGYSPGGDTKLQPPLQTMTNLIGENPLQPAVLQALALYWYSPAGLLVKLFTLADPSYSFENAPQLTLSHNS